MSVSPDLFRRWSDVGAVVHCGLLSVVEPHAAEEEADEAGLAVPEGGQVVGLGQALERGQDKGAILDV